MKFTKLSLVAALAVSAAFAGGDIAPVEPAVEPAPAPAAVAPASTVSGTMKLFYSTNSRGLKNKLFNKAGATGDGYADIKYSRQLMDNVTANVGMAYITTLGLENQLVSGTWANHGANIVKDVAWLNEANVVIGLPAISSFVKVGRQELDTPFFYSEKWSVATNTFDAAVVGNTSLPDTTLIAAWVGRGNGAAGSVVDLNNSNFGGGHKAFIGRSKPAYAFAAINKSLPDTTLQAWYYKIPSVANAYWLQADTTFGEVSVGAQYAGTSLVLNTPNVKTSAWAAKLGYADGPLSAHVAYSKRDNTAGGIDISNIATGHTAGSESRLYTEAYWNYGFVGQQGAKTVSLGASYDLGMATLGAQYTKVKTSLVPNNTKATKGNLTEYALTASTKVGPINADLAYVYDKKGATLKGANTVLVMLSLPFSL